MNPLRHTFSSFLPAALTVAALAAGVCGQTDYHDQSAAYHVGRYIALKSAGYRMVSLDVAGDLTDHRWSAVWEKNAGPTFTSLVGVKELDLRLWWADRIKEGYREQWVTAAGSGANTVYGLIMVKDSRKASYHADMAESTFDTICDTYHELGWLLVSASVHGTASVPRYSAVFAENPEKIRWGLNKNDTATDYQTKFEVFAGKIGVRPAVVTMSASQRYLSVFHDDEVGTWAARHGMTKAGFEAERTSHLNSGFRPIQIMVEGAGSAARYAALFAKGTPAANEVRITGESGGILRRLDELMVGQLTRTGYTGGFMQEKNARNASIAIAKDGNLVFARGYTFAKPGFPITQPTTGFRLASCTKPLTAIATYHLAEKRTDMSRNSRLVDLVALGTPRDSRVNSIRLPHLLNHTSGYSSSWGEGLLDKLPAARDSIQNDNLAFDPGSQTVYSNTGYMLLGLIIEAKSGKTYLDYVQQNLFAPLGVTRAHLMGPYAAANDAPCQEAYWGGSRLLGVLPSPVLAGKPIVNGAHAVSTLAHDASGGMMMSTVDYVRILSGAFDRNIDASILAPSTRDLLEDLIESGGRCGGWDKSRTKTVGGKTYTYYNKGGLWRSAHASVVRRSDGISIAAFCTGPNGPSIDEINAIVDSVTEWPEHDLFPNYGLPAFRKKVTGSTRVFGRGCTGTNGVVNHATAGVPETGETQSFRLYSAPRTSPAILALGASNTAWGRLALPLDLSVVGAAGCMIYTPPTVTLGRVTDAAGYVTLSLTLPQDKDLLGQRFYSQFLVIDARANTMGLTTTNGVETTVGGWR